MKTYTYTFADGTTSTAEVSDELFDALAYADWREKYDDKRETRRHISLDYLNDNGIDFETKRGNPLKIMLALEKQAEYDRLLASVLKPKQIRLYKMITVEGYKEKEIADLEGVSQQAISKRFVTIKKKIKAFFEKRL